MIVWGSGVKSKGPCGDRGHTSSGGQEAAEEDTQIDVLHHHHCAYHRRSYCGGCRQALDIHPFQQLWLGADTLQIVLCVICPQPCITASP